MPILNYTTTIDAGRTVAEIQVLLGHAGADHTYVKFAALDPVALIFEYHGKVYQLPCRSGRIFTTIEKTIKIPKGLRTEKQALRVAWRILHDWLQVQLAFIQSGMVDPEEVFMPFEVVRTDPTTGENETMYEAYKADVLTLPKAKEGKP